MVTATSKKTNPVVAASTPKKAAVKKSPVAAVKKAVVAKPVGVAKPVPKAKPAAVAKPVPAPKVVKAAEAKVLAQVTKLLTVPVEKVKKPKLVRDSFTMPESEYAALGAVKKACLKAGVEVKKSQLLRIGVALLSKTDVPALKKLIAGLAPLKAGRPKKEK
ncbi:hypothetical protein ACO0K9_14420 [Undibacterium sp. Ji50W]|uniref:hypothetical protein n=1 Tax=Undibacterium sp. Ji50W TaxID=3413041 RepID=UPI003BF30446